MGFEKLVISLKLQLRYDINSALGLCGRNLIKYRSMRYLYTSLYVHSLFLIPCSCAPLLLTSKRINKACTQNIRDPKGRIVYVLFSIYTENFDARQVLWKF